MRKCFLPLLAIAFAWSLIVASPANAALIWDGDAQQDTGVFGSLECAASDLYNASSDDGHGIYFVFHKTSANDRCEAKGIKVGGSNYTFQNNSTYYLGWESKVSATSLSTGDFVTFQWKSYPNGDQNYPLLMTVSNGKVNLVYAPPGGGSWQYLWSGSITANVWHRFALAVHTSDSASGGWVELRFNGAQQTLSNGSTRFTGRTWDGYNDPKWGVYDRDQPSDIYNRIDSLKVGTSYGDVD
jgi:hypothetical protein